MSEFTDATIGRYVGQDPEQRKAYALDPAAHMRIETIRQTLDAVERAMVDEGVAEEVRRRVINRVVWGEPEGYVDVHAQMDRQRRAMAESVALSAEALAELLADGAGPVRPDEEPTT